MATVEHQVPDVPEPTVYSVHLIDLRFRKPRTVEAMRIRLDECDLGLYAEAEGYRTIDVVRPELRAQLVGSAWSPSIEPEELLIGQLGHPWHFEDRDRLKQPHFCPKIELSGGDPTARIFIFLTRDDPDGSMKPGTMLVDETAIWEDQLPGSNYTAIQTRPMRKTLPSLIENEGEENERPIYDYRVVCAVEDHSLDSFRFQTGERTFQFMLEGVHVKTMLAA